MKLQCFLVAIIAMNTPSVLIQKAMDQLVIFIIMSLVKAGVAEKLCIVKVEGPFFLVLT